MSVKIKPLGARILVQPLEEKEIKKGGILIPDSAREKPERAKVIVLGTGKKDDEGKKIPFEVKVGDTVLMSKYGGNEITSGDKKYKLLDENDVLAIIC